MIEHFRNVPADTYPPDGCALLVRDAWQTFLGLSGLPEHADRFVTVSKARQTMAGYDGVLLEPIPSQEHLCMVVATRGNHWHCGVYTTEQAPGYVIHTLGKAIKIEPLNLFKRRFDRVEFYRYATHHRVQTPDKAG